MKTMYLTHTNFKYLKQTVTFFPKHFKEYVFWTSYGVYFREFLMWKIFFLNPQHLLQWEISLFKISFSKTIEWSLLSQNKVKTSFWRYVKKEKLSFQANYCNTFGKSKTFITSGFKMILKRVWTLITELNSDQQKWLNFANEVYWTTINFIIKYVVSKTKLYNPNLVVQIKWTRINCMLFVLETGQWKSTTQSRHFYVAVSATLFLQNLTPPLTVTGFELRLVFYVGNKTLKSFSLNNFTG